MSDLKEDVQAIKQFASNNLWLLASIVGAIEEEEYARVPKFFWQIEAEMNKVRAAAEGLTA